MKYLIYFISGSILIAAITIIAEKKSPRIAGIMMCLPVITFLSLLFLALSQGVYFSSRASVWNPIGAIADLVYMGLFAVGISVPAYIQKNVLNKNINEHNKVIELIFGLSIGFMGYFFSILILSRFTVTSGWESLAALWAAAVVFYMLFRGVEEKKVENRTLVSVKEIFFRGLFGGIVVAVVVILGDSAGHMWSGLFSSFPGTITPVLILLHLKNGREMSYSVIKSAPLGLSATALYSCVVWLSYPAYGIIPGTMASYLAVIVFLFFMGGLKDLLNF